jgi:hypothetical protein
MRRTRTLRLGGVAALAMALSIVGGASAALAGPDVPQCYPPDCYYV